MKRLLKIAGLVLALAVAFATGLLWTGMREFASGIGDPDIQSDHYVRQQIEQFLPELPDTAHHLYYAKKGFQDPDLFFACTVPKADMPSLLAHVLQVAAHRGHSTSATDQDMLSRGPDSWDDSAKDPSWDLSSYPDIATLSTNGVTIMHSPAANRVFVCLATY